MAIFYHVDRRETLKENNIINLTKYNDIKSVNNAALTRRLQMHCDSLFPNGVSYHGELYFLRSGSSTKIDPFIEIFFEYVRKSFFPDRPSRFESLYAVETKEEAYKFKEIYGKGHIFKVECDSYFKADMNLLNKQSSILVLSYSAHNYWKPKFP